jgi:hypothetical protein
MRLWCTRVTSRWSVVPVSPGRPVWCVGEDSLKPEGPFTAVAIATLLQDVSTSYRGTDAVDAPYEVGRAERQAEMSIQVGDVRVLVLPNDFAVGEGPWLPRQRVFFSLEAAEAAVAGRTRGDD